MAKSRMMKLSLLVSMLAVGMPKAWANTYETSNSSSVTLTVDNYAEIAFTSEFGPMHVTEAELADMADPPPNATGPNTSATISVTSNAGAEFTMADQVVMSKVGAPDLNFNAIAAIMFGGTPPTLVSVSHVDHTWAASLSAGVNYTGWVTVSLSEEWWAELVPAGTYTGTVTITVTTPDPPGP